MRFLLDQGIPQKVFRILLESLHCFIVLQTV